MTERTPLLVDKNALQGWHKATVAELSSTYLLLMADVLFLELISTDPVARYRCFDKLPEGENPIVLVRPIGQHMQEELRTHKPTGKPSTRPVPMRFRFHPQLRERGYQLPESVQQVVDEARRDLRSKVADLVEQARVVADLVDGRKSELGERRDAAIENLMQQALDLPTIKDFLSQLEPPEGELPLPPIEAMDTSWAWVRYFQARLLFAIDVYTSFGVAVREETFLHTNYRRLEHDVLDFEYVALAALEGTFATNEIKLRRMFGMLVPDGVLVP